ncbi:phage protease [Rhizobium sp. YJ-22]|uniref:phage protease n=1 Tax=Rhizobium sp. YJ-22 TaxID=3037556 RepID=UPI00241261B7|nr:phage protease [Rhizobium sp. YJ-22]MDG3580408.1 phage protease [Rhizobium sp. YJ-22]
MTKRTATRPEKQSEVQPNMAGAATGVVLLDAFSADPEAADTKRGPEWIKVAPRGAFTTRDGRYLVVDPEALVERFNADKIAVPIDIDHATVKKALFGDAAPAVAWIEELQARSDGVYGRVDWLDEGLRILSARTHRYISPSLKLDDANRAIWLHSVALVAAPAASMPAVASAHLSTTPEPKPMLKAIAAALGLSEDAADTSCLSAIATLKLRIDPAVHQQALDQVKTLSAEIEGIKAAGHKAEVNALLETALKAKKISPAQRATYEALSATPEGLAQVKTLIETLGAGLAPSGLDDKQPQGGVATLSAHDRQIIEEMGLEEEAYRKANGLTAA